MNDISTTPPAGETVRIDYVPRPGLLRLTLVNALLNIVTLTVYRFWARTNVRRHIWASVYVNGHPLEYTGKGSELFLGALIVFGVLGLPAILLVVAVSIAYGPEHEAVAGVQGLLFLIFTLLWGAAVFRARRYQLSRTLWRGIRGALEGSAAVYSLTYFGAFLARAISFGWLTPLMNLNLQEQIIGGMRFGSTPFRFKGRAGPLYPSYAFCWLLMAALAIGALVLFGGLISNLAETGIAQTFQDVFGGTSSDAQDQAVALVIGLFVLLLIGYLVLYPMVWAFYTARELSIFASYTSLGEARFRLEATAGSIIRLAIGNLLLWIFTLGIAQPYIQQRLVRYLCDRLKVEGRVDIDAIRQSQQPLDKTGEGLADALDIGGL